MRNKSYYPKSQIIENLVTTGKEWMLINGTEYIGLYHRYIDGTVMTGASYSPEFSQPLKKYIDLNTDFNQFVYNTLKKKVENTFPKASVSLPSLDDYKIGKYTRYFIQKRNDLTDIMEINNDQFKSWQKPSGGIDKNLYNAMPIDWKLTGPLYDLETGEFGVYSTNYRIVQLSERKIPNISNFLTDYTEFTIYSPVVSEDIKKLFGA